VLDVHCASPHFKGPQAVVIGASVTGRSAWSTAPTVTKDENKECEK
jgi:hypothetical protein